MTEATTMGRKRQYATSADRLRAFRARSDQEQAKPAPLRSTPSGPKQKASRPARLLALCRGVQALLDEYQTWRDRLPESLQESDLAAKLDEAVEGFTEVAEALAAIDLPKGYGRY